MNEREHLILGRGKNITSDVALCQYNSGTGKYDVTFKSGGTYQYAYNSIEWVREPDALNPRDVRIFREGREFFNIREVRVFRAHIEDYWHIRFDGGSSVTHPQSALTVTFNCLNKQKAKDCLGYLRKIAAINELKGDNGEVILEKQYEKLIFVGKDTAMALYLNPIENKICTCNKPSLIFPFGGNASQFKAVENALCNQISVIQGPPGTGKTQTILNVIANLLLAGKTIQVVSFNNSATENVFEKLMMPKYNMGFLVAALGNSGNKKRFVQTQSGHYPDISDWNLTALEQSELTKKINDNITALYDTFSNRVRLAQAKLELNSLLLEVKYFDQYCNENKLKAAMVKPRRRLNASVIMSLWQECIAFSERDRAISLWFKIKSTFVYGIAEWRFYTNDLSAIITLLQKLFYEARRTELAKEISDLEGFLRNQDADRKMDELMSCSLAYLRAKLFERFGNKSERKLFTEEDLWKSPNDVVNDYPIVLSTTFSSCSSLKGVTYDYLIMDEASQVDVATGALAMSCAKNAVIVGDLKQLPNVVKADMKKKSDGIFESFDLAQGYSFSENSFLKSVCSVLPNLPQTLLREHYRCHPKIIGFCNQKFYNNELIIMKEDCGEDDAMMVYKTVIGNHRRDHMNQRQIEVTIREALPLFNEEKATDIGIIAPYRDQVNAITSQLASAEIDVNTVHKFQGREKSTIVMTTVDDVVTDFSDDPYLLNVAVSRAIKRFCLVASANEQPVDSNIGDLISYIEYNNFQVFNSEIYSVFDMLYEQYTDARIAFLKKHSRLSEYDSENLMYVALVDLLKSRESLSLEMVCHHPLMMLIRDPKRLNDEERLYAMNAATHVDFLIYNRITKKPVLVIEVDGFHFHKPGTKQCERDRMKDHILSLYKIPVLRFATNGSDEVAQVGRALDEYENGRLKNMGVS